MGQKLSWGGFSSQNERGVNGAESRIILPEVDAGRERGQPTGTSGQEVLLLLLLLLLFP